MDFDMIYSKSKSHRREALREKISRLEKELTQAKKDLENVDCNHDWSDSVYDPIIYPGYRSPGDPPGTMGVDRQLPSYIPREEIPRWTRKCSKCDTVQETKKVVEETTTIKKPKFPDDLR